MRIDPVNGRTGVFFGLSAEDYHADPGFGSSSIIELYKHPCNWAWRRFTPFAEPRIETPAMKFGSAVHTYVLEGADTFEARYCHKPDMPPGTLTSLEELKAHCKTLGLPVSGTKAELAKRIRTVDQTTPLEPEIMAQFDLERGEKIVLSENDYARIKVAGHAIAQNPALSKAFTGGFPEVSVFWEQGGLRMKARFDYLKIKSVVDLKSTSNWREIDMERFWACEVANRGYDIQAVHYLNGRAMLPKFIAEGSVFTVSGPTPDAEWLKNVAEHEDPAWVWVVYQSENAPISEGFQFPVGSPWHESAANRIATAIDNHNRFLAEQGRGVWLKYEPIKMLAEEDLPPWHSAA